MVIVNRRLWLLTGYAVPRNEEESLFSRQALLWLQAVRALSSGLLSLLNSGFCCFFFFFLFTALKRNQFHVFFF